jgi:L-lactate permease
MWSQVYDPFNNVWLSTMAAAIPVVVMLAALAFFHIKAHIAAILALGFCTRYSGVDSTLGLACATKWYGHEGEILRYVFFHSIALAALVGILVTLQAYVHPFTLLVH